MKKHDRFSHCRTESAVTSDHARVIMQFAEQEVCERSQHARTVFHAAESLLFVHMIPKNLRD